MTTATFLIKRGKRAVHRQARAHLAHHDPHGRIDGSWCGAEYSFSSNVPWGLKVCLHCLQRAGYGRG